MRIKDAGSGLRRSLVRMKDAEPGNARFLMELAAFGVVLPKTP
jgi:hypothetical protein